MKKYGLLIAILALAVACSSRKKERTNKMTHGFLAYYNTLFNGKEALESELNNRKKNHQENYYKPYIKLFMYDNEDEAVEGESNDIVPSFGGDMNASKPKSKGASTLEIAEAKALKAIENHSVMKDGVERNKTIFDAYLILAKARMYKGEYLSALDAINTLLSQMKSDKRLPLAKIYEARLYYKMEDYYRADELFTSLKNEGVAKKYKGLLSAFYAENLLAEGKKEAAVDELADAYAFNKNRNLRSRIAFLRGQILADLGRGEEARESFATAYKKSNNFEFEVKSQIEIAKTFNGTTDDYEGAKQYLEKIAKKGTYASRKNEFYYALGLMALKAGKEDEANAFFEKSLKEKMSDGQIRGLTYYEIGKKYLEKDDYIAAGAYYDSAVSTMTYQPQKETLENLSKNIKKISKNYYLIKKNDSILALTKMSVPEREAFFTQHIEKLKAQEAKEEAERKKQEADKGFATADFSLTTTNQPMGFMDFGGGKSKGFYFANASTVSKGEANFKQIWGDRALADNWRYSAKTNTIEDAKNEALGKTEVKNPRRFETSFYIEQIPTDTEAIAQLKKDRDTALLGLGIMYEDYFSNTPLATKTLMDLVAQNPEEEVKLQALYQAFSINYGKNEAAANQAKELILRDFPYTHYAEFVKNPKRETLSAPIPEVETAYKKAFDLYTNAQYEESKQLIESTIEKYPKDALVPKLSLLNAYNTGKTAGKEIMILQLQQIALNYERLPEGEKAKELLHFLKSDLDSPKEEKEAPKRVQKLSKQVNEDPAVEQLPPPDHPGFNNMPKQQVPDRKLPPQ
ncbi:tetratricopeptide repeat protein [Riemerella columbina]|uniref:type IX secretion system periplasmic lipoprotein PorW/SprE n=1 Tax=Riemerella columbina TaxID=103810 RepID=UPI00036836BF|nr:hypothetical protein [Riemerella columbina]